MAKNGQKKADPLVAARHEGVFEVHGLQFRPLANGNRLACNIQCDFSAEVMAAMAKLAGKVCKVSIEQIIDPVLLDKYGHPMIGDGGEGPGDDGMPPLFEKSTESA